MKRIHIKTCVGAALLSLFLVGCSDLLKETPRSSFTPEYFKTQAGVMGGLTYMYSHLRGMYGQGYYYNACETGTDESTYGQSADGNFKNFDLSGAGSMTSDNFPMTILWNATFPNINTANGVIEYGTTSGVSDALLSEARFFRAFDYFLLVQTFGGVPLDLGAGELKFNTSTSRVSKRNTVPEVYTKAIFPDMLLAVKNLPDAGRVTGGATKTLARLYLAKAYLTYGWWLQNPKNIPTYPTCDRTDPDGHNAAWYFQKAYDYAVEGIQNAGGNFALQSTFYDVNVATNDRNKEILLYADHTQTSELYNGGTSLNGFGSGGAPDNFAGWMQNWSYTAITSSKTDWSSPSLVSSVQREAAQALGRPWTRMAPPISVITSTFADKSNDSRYDGTFTTVYRGNWAKGGVTNATLYNANGMQVANGDAILSFLGSEPAQTIDYSNAVYKSSIGAGVLPGRADFVLPPSGISRRVFPGLWKLGPYRTDNGVGLGSPNAGSTRPYNIAKFSELFFVAAEAAVKGATPKAITGTYANDGTAYGLINILRARAGKWRFSNANNATLVADNSAAMVAVTPTPITIDYILAERSREYYGEGYRWFDLVRTQTWADYAKTYQICGNNYGDHTPVTYTRTIPDNYYLRPIPQGQLDGLEMTADEKKAYQNPAYQ